MKLVMGNRKTNNRCQKLFLKLFKSPISSMTAIVVAMAMQCNADETQLNLCGAKCLHVALISLKPGCATLDQLTDHPAGPTIEGMSLADLQRIATDFGFHALPCRISLDALETVDRPFACVAHLTSNHFVLIQRTDQHFVYVIDPPLKKKVQREAFERMWSGNVLLVAVQPIKLPQSSRGPFVVGAVLLIAGLAVAYWSRVHRTRIFVQRP